MFDVLEHIPDDVETLRTLYEITKPIGYLIIMCRHTNRYGAISTTLHAIAGGMNWSSNAAIPAHACRRWSVTPC